LPLQTDYNKIVSIKKSVSHSSGYFNHKNEKIGVFFTKKIHPRETQIDPAAGQYFGVFTA